MSRYEKQLRRKNRKEKKARRNSAQLYDPLAVVDGPYANDVLYAIEVLDQLFPPDIFNSLAAVCEITNNPMGSEYNRSVAETFGENQDDLRQMMKSEPTRAIGLLKQMLERLPDHPMLLNWLAVCHTRLEDMATAGEIAQLNLAKNPDYLFARIGVAEHYVLLNDFDAALAAMGGSWDLKTLYPERTVFHVTEAEAIWSVAAKFYQAIGDSLKSSRYIGAIICVNPENALVKIAMESLSKATENNMATEDLDADE